MILEKDSVVCCLGSSTTQHGYWVHDVERYFAEHRPSDKITFFNCGVGGDTARLSRFRLEEDVFCYKPTHIFVMFGLNDIKRELYAPSLEETQELLIKRNNAIDEYEDGLRFLAKKINDENISVIFGVSVNYDTIQNSDVENCVGCADAIIKCWGKVKKVAKEFDCEYIDIGREFSIIKKEWDKNKEWLYNPDRVHPTRIGYGIIAKIFLKNVGFQDIKIPLSVDEWGCDVPKSNKRLFDLEQTIRDIAYIDWGRFHPLHGECLGNNYKIQTMLEMYADKNCKEWLKKSIENYFKFSQKKDLLKLQLIIAKNSVY